MYASNAELHPFTGARPRRHRGAMLAVLLTAAMALSALNPLAADAKESSRSTYSGVAVSTDWTQKDGTEVGTTPFGNTHVGFLNAEQTTKDQVWAYGWITDYDCLPGEQPGHGGGHGFDDEPEPEEPKDGCIYLGERYLEGSDDLQLNVNNKLGSATLKGTLIAYGGFHGEGVVGQPVANIIWTAAGNTFKSRYTSRWTDGTTTYSDSYRSTGRNAVMGGTLGPMGFDPALSGGTMSIFTSSNSFRAR